MISQAAARRRDSVFLLDRPRYNDHVRFVSSTRNRNRQLGAYAVEFSLVVPLLMVLLFGAIDGGRYVISGCMMRYAAIVGSRMASMPHTAAVTDVQDAAVGAAPFLGLSRASVTVSITNGVTPKAFTARAAGDTASVVVTYNYTAFLSAFSKFVSRSGRTTTSAVTVE
jgi:Flp pilus assembly protein TadG